MKVRLADAPAAMAATLDGAADASAAAAATLDRAADASAAVAANLDAPVDTLEALPDEGKGVTDLRNLSRSGVDMYFCGECCC